MKRISVILVTAFLLLNACEKIQDGIVDPRDNQLQFKLSGIQMPDTLIYGKDDSVVTIGAKIVNPQNLSSLFFDIYDNQGDLINASNQLMDNGDTVKFGDASAGDGIYSALITFSATDQSGSYYFRFSGKDINDGMKLLGEKKLSYFNNQPEFPPVISNLSIPDSINREVNFIFSLKVTDGNGLADVKSVYFELYRPDSTVLFFDSKSQNTHFPMFDDGNTSKDGDEKAGDGIFSLKNSFGKTAQTGYWRFEFRAIDKADSLSNKITHELLVK